MRNIMVGAALVVALGACGKKTESMDAAASPSAAAPTPTPTEDATPASTTDAVATPAADAGATPSADAVAPSADTVEEDVVPTDDNGNTRASGPGVGTLGAALVALRQPFTGPDDGAAAWPQLVDPELGVYVEDYRTKDRGLLDHRWLGWRELEPTLARTDDPIHRTIVAPARALLTTYDPAATGPDTVIRCDEAARACTSRAGQRYRFATRADGQWRLVGVMLHDTGTDAERITGWSTAFDGVIDARTAELGWGKAGAATSDP